MSGENKSARARCAANGSGPRSQTHAVGVLEDVVLLPQVGGQVGVRARDGSKRGLGWKKKRKKEVQGEWAGLVSSSF